jgi:hypothetical protein
VNLANRLFKIAAIYFVAGSALGLAMGITGNFAPVPVHAHLNLLGWVSLALAGLLYRTHPLLAQTRLARIHFWMHNISLPVMMAALLAYRMGMAALQPLVAVGAVGVMVGIICFTANIVRTKLP